MNNQGKQQKIQKLIEQAKIKKRRRTAGKGARVESKCGQDDNNTIVVKSVRNQKHRYHQKRTTNETEESQKRQMSNNQCT